MQNILCVMDLLWPGCSDSISWGAWRGRRKTSPTSRTERRTRTGRLSSRWVWSLPSSGLGRPPLRISYIYMLRAVRSVMMSSVTEDVWGLSMRSIRFQWLTLLLHNNICFREKQKKRKLLSRRRRSWERREWPSVKSQSQRIPYTWWSPPRSRRRGSPSNEVDLIVTWYLKCI